jgi:L-lactate dehydrogenase complex protein LldG
MTRELAAVGGVVHRARSASEARQHIANILGKARARRVVRTRAPLLEELDLGLLLSEVGVEVTVCELTPGTSRETIREAEFSAEAGLTAADYGVADTGTLALLTRPGEGRAVSLVPPLHIAVLRSRDLVYELGAFFDRVEPSSLPSALTFVTGPSRTADIEQILIRGVHGPRELHLVLLD